MRYLPFQVAIKSRDGTLFEGQAISISSTNSVGDFDVAGNHANFVTPVNKFIKLQTEKGTYKDFEIEAGLLHAAANQIDVFVGLVVREEDLAGVG